MFSNNNPSNKPSQAKVNKNDLPDSESYTLDPSETFLKDASDTFFEVDSNILSSSLANDEKIRKIAESSQINNGLNLMSETFWKIFGEKGESLNKPETTYINNRYTQPDIQINLMNNRDSGVEKLESMRPKEKQTIFARLNNIKDSFSKIDWEKVSDNELTESIKKGALIITAVGAGGVVIATGLPVIFSIAGTLSGGAFGGLAGSTFYAGTGFGAQFLGGLGTYGSLGLTGGSASSVATMMAGLSAATSTWATRKLFKKPQVQKAVLGEQSKQLESMLDRSILEKVRAQLSSTENKALDNQTILSEIASIRIEITQDGENIENIDDFIKVISVEAANKLSLSGENRHQTNTSELNLEPQLDTLTYPEGIKNKANQLLDQIKKAKEDYQNLSSEQVIFGVIGSWMQDISTKPQATTPYDKEILDRIQTVADRLNEGVHFDFSGIGNYQASLGWSEENKELLVWAANDVLNSFKSNTTNSIITPLVQPSLPNTSPNPDQGLKIDIAESYDDAKTKENFLRSQAAWLYSEIDASWLQDTSPYDDVNILDWDVDQKKIGYTAFNAFGDNLDHIQAEFKALSLSGSSLLDEIQLTADEAFKGILNIDSCDFSKINDPSERAKWDKTNAIVLGVAVVTILDRIIGLKNSTTPPVQPTPITAPDQGSEIKFSTVDSSLNQLTKLESIEGMTPQSIVEWYITNIISPELQQEANLKLETMKVYLVSQNLDFNSLMETDLITLPIKLLNYVNDDKYKNQFPILDITANYKAQQISKKPTFLDKNTKNKYAMSGSEILRLITQKILDDVCSNAPKISRFPNKPKNLPQVKPLELSDYSTFDESIINELHERVSSKDYYTYDHPTVQKELVEAKRFLQDQDIITDYQDLRNEDTIVVLDLEHIILAKNHSIQFHEDLNSISTISGKNFQSLIVAKILDALQNEQTILGIPEKGKNVDSNDLLSSASAFANSGVNSANVPSPDNTTSQAIPDKLNLVQDKAYQWHNMKYNYSDIAKILDQARYTSKGIAKYKNNLTERQQESYDYLVGAEEKLSNAKIWLSGNMAQFFINNQEELEVFSENIESMNQRISNPQFQELLALYGGYNDDFPSLIKDIAKKSIELKKGISQNYDYLISELSPKRVGNFEEISNESAKLETELTYLQNNWDTTNSLMFEKILSNQTFKTLNSDSPIFVKVSELRSDISDMEKALPYQYRKHLYENREILGLQTDQVLGLEKLLNQFESDENINYSGAKLTCDGLNNVLINIQNHIEEIENDLNNLTEKNWKTDLGEHKISEVETLFKINTADIPRSQILFTINNKIESLSNSLKSSEDFINKTFETSNRRRKDDQLKLLDPDKARLAKMILLQREITKAMAENENPTTRENVVENTISGDLDESDYERYVAEPIVEKSEAEIIKDTSEQMEADLQDIQGELHLQNISFYTNVTNTSAFKSLDRSTPIYKKAADLESRMSDLKDVAPYQYRKYLYENGEVLGLPSEQLSGLKDSLELTQNHELIGRRGPSVLKQDYNSLKKVVDIIKKDLASISEELKNVDMVKQNEMIQNLIQDRNLAIDDIIKLDRDRMKDDSLLDQQKAKVDKFLAKTENPILVQNDKSNLDAIIDRLQSYILREANAIASYENDVLNDSPNLEPKELAKHLARVNERKTKLADAQELLNYVGNRKEGGYTPITPTINVVNISSENSLQQNLKPE